MTVGSSDFSHDRELIAMVCSTEKGERDKAWEKIYRDNYVTIRALVKRMKGEPEDFTDIYHDALLSLMRNIEQKKFEYRSTISTYLYRICVNHCFKKFNLDARTLQAEKEFGEKLGLEGDYDMQRDALWNRISSILASELREECREILVKFYFEGQSMKQLQEYFNVNSEQAAKNKKMRCLNYLRRAVENADINPEALKK
jgi:RNA polymerase sigma factor (sigma-70 family)